jgi:cystathionine beta-lyase
MDLESLFDFAVDRRQTHSLKWSRYQENDIIPMWVADMDFRCPDAVIQALRQFADHGVFGYTVRPDNLNAVVAEWVFHQHHWHIQENWIVWLPGLVCALNVACRGLTSPEQQICTFTPIYPPFLTSPEYSQRNLIRCPLGRKDGRYIIDFDRFTDTLTDAALLLLCSPHNPVGRVWTRQELNTLVKICIKKNIILCSDEIHCDLVLDSGVTHIPIASLSDEAAQHTITLMAASKTFNIPGLNCAFAIIPNPQLRQRFRKTTFGIVPHAGLEGYVATLAAFRDSRPWHNLLIKYLRSNRDFLCDTLHTIEGLEMDLPEATYLGWIDTRKLGLKNPVHFFEQAGVGLSDGAEFDGPGFVRLNYGCPRARLTEALRRMRNALSGRRSSSD